MNRTGRDHLSSLWYGWHRSMVLSELRRVDGQLRRRLLWLKV